MSVSYICTNTPQKGLTHSSFLQSVLPFFVATKLSKIRRATLDKPTPERYVAAELNTVGLQTQTNGYLPHAIMVCNAHLHM